MPTHTSSFKYFLCERLFHFTPASVPVRWNWGKLYSSVHIIIALCIFVVTVVFLDEIHTDLDQAIPKDMVKVEAFRGFAWWHHGSFGHAHRYHRSHWKWKPLCERNGWLSPLTSRNVFARALGASFYLRPLWKLVLQDWSRWWLVARCWLGCI